MHFQYTILLPLVIGAVAASSVGNRHSRYTLRAPSGGLEASKLNKLRIRQDDESEETVTGECKNPETEVFYCLICGGRGDDGKCKGFNDEDNKDLWKGCDCRDDPDWSREAPPLIRPNLEEHKQAVRDRGNLETEAPGPVKQNKLLGILTDYLKNPGSVEDASKLNWLFFALDAGSDVGCSQDPLTSRMDTIDILGDEDHTFYPGGTFELQMPGFDEPCEYRNDGTNSGRLFCPGQEIACRDDPRDKDPSDNEADKGVYECGDYNRQPVFICEY